MYKFLAVAVILAIGFIVAINLSYQRDADEALANARAPAPGAASSKPDADSQGELSLDDDTREQLIKGFNFAADRLNENAPIKVDSRTTMDKATVGPGAKLTYHYTLDTGSQVPGPDWAQNTLRPRVMKMACANEQIKPSLQYGGTLVYSYSAKNGRTLGSFKVDRRDCGYKKKTP